MTIGGTMRSEIIQDANLFRPLEGLLAIGYAIPEAMKIVKTTEILTALKLVNKADLKSLANSTSRKLFNEGLNMKEVLLLKA